MAADISLVVVRPTISCILDAISTVDMHLDI
jgi:hypothetical protein